MCLKLINLFGYVSIVMLFYCCTNKVICYEKEICFKKHGVSFSIETENQGSFSIILEGRGNFKLQRNDSLKLRFYRYNINLKQKNYYNALLNTSDVRTISGVLYEEPIDFFYVNFKNDLINQGINRYKIEVPNASLINAINNFGSADNKLQIKNQFQVFMVGFRNNVMVYHIPSSFFKID